MRILHRLCGHTQPPSIVRCHRICMTHMFSDSLLTQYFPPYARCRPPPHTVILPHLPCYPTHSKSPLTYLFPSISHPHTRTSRVLLHTRPPSPYTPLISHTYHVPICIHAEPIGDSTGLVVSQVVLGDGVQVLLPNIVPVGLLNWATVALAMLCLW